MSAPAEMQERGLNPGSDVGPSEPAHAHAGIRFWLEALA